MRLVQPRLLCHDRHARESSLPAVWGAVRVKGFAFGLPDGLAALAAAPPRRGTHEAYQTPTAALRRHHG